MSDYVKSTNFATKDNLSSGNPAKIVKGTEIDTEFNNIATAISTKQDSSAAVTLTGTQTLTNKTINGSNNTLTNVSLTTAVTGTLPVANGGTGATSLTANNVILGNGTSAVQVVAPSTSGNVLTSNGTTWTSAAAPSSALTLLATLTPTAAANVDFLSTFSSTYDDYLIIAEGIIPTATSALQMQFAVAGTVDTASNYFSPTDGLGTGAGAQLTLSLSFSGSGVGLGGSCIVEINNANNTTTLKSGFARAISSSGTEVRYQSSGIGYKATNAISGFRLFWSGGDFTAAGKVRVYGYKKS